MMLCDRILRCTFSTCCIILTLNAEAWPVPLAGDALADVMFNILGKNPKSQTAEKKSNVSFPWLSVKISFEERDCNEVQDHWNAHCFCPLLIWQTEKLCNGSLFLWFLFFREKMTRKSHTRRVLPPLCTEIKVGNYCVYSSVWVVRK